MGFLRGFSQNALSTGLVFGLGFVNQSLLANGLDQMHFGRLAWWTNTAMLGVLLWGEWLNKGSTYVVGQDRDRHRVVRVVLVYGTVLGGALLLLALLGSVLAPGLLPEPGRLYWVLLAGLIGLGVVQKAGEAVLLGEERIARYSLVPVAFVTAYLAGNLLVLEATDAGLEGVLIVWLSATCLACLVAFAGLVKGSGGQPLQRSVVERLLRVGGRGAASVVLVFLLFRSDYYLVSYFMGEASLGTYRVATVFADLMQRLPNVAGVVLLPKVIRGQDEGERISLRVAQVVLLFSLLAGTGVVLLGKPLIGLFFSKYPDAYAPLLWMLPGLLLSGFGSVLNTKLAGQGYPAITLWAPALALGVNAALNLLLIPAWGLSGAAVSSSAGHGLWALIVSACYLRRAGLRWRDLLRVRTRGGTLH